MFGRVTARLGKRGRAERGAVGTDGRRGIERPVLGGMAESVPRVTAAPVLMGRSG